MTEPVVLAETPGSRSIPTFEIPGWNAEFGVVAGVTGRGTEASGFDLGLASDQPTRQVLDRWRRLTAEFSAFHGTVIGRQVHGTTVRWHRAAAGWAVFEGVDGHATDTTGVLLTVSLADCIPVYLLDPVRRAVALLHSGWRGTAGRILAAGVDQLRDRAGSRPADLVAHIGVGICSRCYQVGADVATACGQPPADGGPVQLDLRSVLAGQAEEQGIGRVSVSPHCSAHMGDRFFSHRGSGGADGRMVAFLGLPSLE